LAASVDPTDADARSGVIFGLMAAGSGLMPPHIACC
jgi:hypothetical protein